MKKTFLIFGAGFNPGIALVIAGILGGDNRAQSVIIGPGTTPEDLPDFVRNNDDFETINLKEIVAEEGLSLGDIPAYFWNRFVKTGTTLADTIARQYQDVLDVLPVGWTPEAVNETAEKLPFLNEICFDFLTTVDEARIQETYEMFADALLGVKLADQATKNHSFSGSLANIVDSTVSVVRSAVNRSKEPWTMIVCGTKVSNLAGAMTVFKKVINKTTSTNLALVKTGESEYTLVALTEAKSTGAFSRKQFEAVMPEVIDFLLENLDDKIVTFNKSAFTIVFSGDLGQIAETITNTLNQYTTETVEAITTA